MTFKQATWDYVQNTATATTNWGDIGDWDTSGVKDFSHAFSQERDMTGGSYVSDGNPKAAEFVFTAISKWITTSVTSLEGTFRGASKLNADLSKWSVAKVTTMRETFSYAFEFTGAGLASWDTAGVTSLILTFGKAGEMNSDLSKWKTAQVVMLKNTFKSASKFTGAGVDLWDVSKVTDMDSTFSAATSLTACSKRKIADAWKSNSAFTDTNYDTDWADEICVLVLPAKEVKVRGYSDDEGACCRRGICLVQNLSVCLFI